MMSCKVKLVLSWELNWVEQDLFSEPLLLLQSTTSISHYIPITTIQWFNTSDLRFRGEQGKGERERKGKEQAQAQELRISRIEFSCPVLNQHRHCHRHHLTKVFKYSRHILFFPFILPLHNTYLRSFHSIPFHSIRSYKEQIGTARHHHVIISTHWFHILSLRTWRKSCTLVHTVHITHLFSISSQAKPRQPLFLNSDNRFLVVVLSGHLFPSKIKK